MTGRARALVLSAGICVFTAASAADVTTYQYDALGRLRRVQYSGGPADGKQLEYRYDASGNRHSVVSGAVGSGNLVLTPKRTVATATTAGVTLGVTVTGQDLNGIVYFYENGTLLGSTAVYGGEAVIVLEGFAVGTHTITVTYSGDLYNDPYTFTFTLKVNNLSWLPAVLEILLSN